MKRNSKFGRVRPKRRDLNKTRGVRHTPEEKARILKTFDKESEETGLLVASAKKAGVSFSTICRWHRDSARIKEDALSESVSQELSINHAVEVLAGGATSDRFMFLEAIFKFVAWLKWPTNEYDHVTAVTMCVLSYLQKSTGALKLDQLDQASAAFAIRSIRIDVLLRVFSFETPAPSFEAYNIEYQPYTHYDVLADLVWFLLALDQEKIGRKLKPSLNKAFYMQEKGAFKYKWIISHRTFRTHWALNAPSAPFYYIDRFHPGPNWDLDPNSESFVEDVDRLLEQREEIKLYFSQCRWAVEKLTSILDRRAVGRIGFPLFPPDLVAKAVSPKALTPGMLAELRGYGNAYKYL